MRNNNGKLLSNNLWISVLCYANDLAYMGRSETAIHNFLDNLDRNEEIILNSSMKKAKVIIIFLSILALIEKKPGFYLCHSERILSWMTKIIMWFLKSVVIPFLLCDS